MSLINVENLSFAYDGNYDMIFENVSFQIDTNWKLGFIGRNGRGKTTFLNLLLGKYKYSGNISADVNFEYFPYEVKDKNIDTIDILRNISPDSMDWEIFRETAQLDVVENALYRPFRTLSNGEQTKALLAALFLASNSFLLIDEPTNHLDETARSVVKDYLKLKKGFILVSHDRVLLDECVNHVLSINRTNIEVQRGNFSSWWGNKKSQDNFELTQNEKLKKEINRMAVSARRSGTWSDHVESSKNGTRNSGSKLDKGYVGHKAAKMMKRAKSIENRQQTAMEEKSKLFRNMERNEPLVISPLIYHSSRLVELNHVNLFYGQKAVCSNANFSVLQGERVAIRGKNGCGKSTILKIICGDPIECTGTVFRPDSLKISYVPQDTSYLCGTLTEYAGKRNINETFFKSILRKLGFERVQFEKDMSDFSEGQKKKVLIAASLCEQAHLYVWDEPLNYIDVLSRMQIEELILKFVPTLIFVEHDTVFTNKIATKTVNID